MRNILLLVIFLSSIVYLINQISQSGDSHSRSTLEVPYFQGKVSSFKSPLQFSLDCCQQDNLQLGMVSVTDNSIQNISAIEKVLRSYQLFCTGLGHPPINQKQPTYYVYCNTETEKGTLVSQLLFEKGLVVERCEFSGNQFGSC